MSVEDIDEDVEEEDDDELDEEDLNMDDAGMEEEDEEEEHELEEDDEDEVDDTAASTAPVVQTRTKWNPFACLSRANQEHQASSGEMGELKAEVTEEDEKAKMKLLGDFGKSETESKEHVTLIAGVKTESQEQETLPGVGQTHQRDIETRDMKEDLLNTDVGCNSDDGQRIDCAQSERRRLEPKQELFDGVSQDDAKTSVNSEEQIVVNEEGGSHIEVADNQLQREKWLGGTLTRKDKFFDFGDTELDDDGDFVDEDGEEEYTCDHEESFDIESREEEVMLDYEGSESSYEDEDEVEEFFQAIARQDCSTIENVLSQKPRYILSEDILRRSPLHAAVLKGNHDILEILLSCLTRFRRSAKPLVIGMTLPEQGGESLLHLALSVSFFEETQRGALGCIKSLIHASAKVNALNAMGRSPLHLACMHGDCHAIDTLLTHQADPGIQDALQNYPLHYAIDSQNRRSIEAMLIASDPKLFVGKTHPLYRIIDSHTWEAVFLMDKMAWPIEGLDMSTFADYAQARCLDKQWTFVQNRRDDFVGLEATASFDDFHWPTDIFAPASTALITHEICMKHGKIPHDVDDLFIRQTEIDRIHENPNRLEILCGKFGILRSQTLRGLRWYVDPPLAPMVDLLRVHEYAYIQKFQKRVQELARAAPEGFHKSASSRWNSKICDVHISKDTWEAARRACGCLLQAVDLVMDGSTRNAFCAVRPPGHHLGPQGAVDKELNDLEVLEGSQGFCVLNNVAVGAAYALSNYRKSVRKVAILDFDVHHGNGTEAIVRNVMERRWKSQAQKFKFIEVAGTRDELSGKLKMKLPPRVACKPWLDPSSDSENIFFASVHGYDAEARFYPGSGQSCSESTPRVINVALAPGSDSQCWRRALERKVFPSLLSFDPDLIFLSAGFDAHGEDPVGNCALTDVDYVWITQNLVSIANQCCQGKLISTLEGGYNTLAENLSPLALSVAGHVRTLMCTSADYRAPRKTLKRKESGESASGSKRLKLTVRATPSGSPPKDESQLQDFTEQPKPIAGPVSQSVGLPMAAMQSGDPDVMAVSKEPQHSSDFKSECESDGACGEDVVQLKAQMNLANTPKKSCGIPTESMDKLVPKLAP